MQILNSYFDSSNQGMLIFCMGLCALRIFLEFKDYDFSQLPMTRSLAKAYGEERLRNFHKMGLYISIGYIILFAPELLLS